MIRTTRTRARQCGWCQQPFTLADRRPWAKYCSFKCKDLAHIERRRNGAPRVRKYGSKTNLVREVKCSVCQQSFIRKRLGMSFCSRKCWLKDCQSRIVPKMCANCGKSFTPKDLYEQKSKRFCGNECRLLFMRGVNSPTYRDGRGQFRGADWNIQSESARNRDGGCKSLCHDTEWKQRKEKLSVDHIVAYGLVLKICPEKSPNDLINLLSLCRRCHAIKTSGPESRLYRGDIVGFIQGMSTIMEKEIVLSALRHYGLLSESNLGPAHYDCNMEKGSKRNYQRTA